MNFKPNMLFLNRSFDKKRLKALLLWFRLNLSENAALKAVEILQGLGFRSATQGAISLGLDDLKTPTSKGGRVFQAQVEVALAHHEHHRGNRTPVELFQHLVDTWHRTSQDLTTEVVQLFHSTERVNPVYMMAFSGARGNISQVRQLVGMRGLMADPRGQIVGFPILSNFREGLTITEYFVSCYGARKGVVDTAIRTADAGYLTRRLADVSHHVVVRTTNCGTHESILLRDIKEGQKTILSLANRLVGRVLAEHIFLPTSPGSDSMIGFIDEVDRFVSKGKPNPNYGEPAPPVLSSSFADPISKAELRTSTERKPIDFVNKPLPQRNTGALLTSDREPAPPSETRGSGLPIVYVSKGSKALLNIEDVSKVRDRVKLNFVQSAKTIIYRNSEITSSLASKLAEHYLEIPVRSPLSCSLPWGVCQLCYGWGLSEGRRVTLGEAVGIIAAQSIGEPGTQLTLRTFHTGGVFSGELLNEIRSPYNGTVIFPTPLQGLLLRTPHGQIAFLTKVSGKMKISETEVHFASKIEDLDLSKSIDCIDEVIGFSSKAKGELAPHNAEQEKTDNFVKKSIDFVDKSFALQRRSLPSQAKKNIGVDTSTNCFEGEAVRSSALLKGSLSKEAEESVADKLTGQINGQALRSKVLPKQDSEFCIQPSTVIFVKQKEHVINNQLLAEFSASTLQSVNDQIEITQQVLSETAGQIWFKEIEYGNRKGPGSGSLGTYFSSQKLGGIWVLAGKPTASSNPIIDTNYYNPLTNIEDVSKAKKCYANPSLAPRACQTYSFDEWQRDKVSDREPLLCLTSSNIEDVKSAKPCSILSVSSKPVALQEGTHALLKGSLQKPVVSPGDVGCTQRVKKQETDLINWDLSNKPLKSFIPLVIIMRGKQRFSLRSRGTCKTQNGVNETIKINLVVSKKPITASINLSTSSIDNPSNEPLITPYASSSIHLFKVIAKNTKTNILGKTTILLHEKGENKTNFHKNCNTHLVFNNFVLSNFSKFPKINELPLKRKYLFKYHTFGIQHRLKRSINTRYTKTSTPPIIYLQNNSGVLKYNYVLGYSQAISSNRHTLRSNGGADSLSNISVASFVSRGEAVRSSALLNGSLSKAVTPSIYVSYEVAKMNLLGVNKVVLGQLNSKEKIANHLVLLTSSALRTNTNISNIEDVTPLGNASLTSYLLVVRSKKKPITSPINRCEAQGESERAPYEMLGQDVKEVKKRVSIPLTTELGQGVQFSQGKRRLAKTPVYTFQSGCPNVNHVAKPFDKFGALSAYYMKSSNSFFEKTKIRLCVPSEAKRYFSFARHAYDISNAKHLKNSTLVYPESLYSKEVSSSKNKFTFMQGKTRRSSKKLDMLPLLSETDLVTFAYRAKLKGVGHKRDFIVKKSSFGVRDNSIALPPLPVLPSLAPYFNKTSFSFSASLASFNASLNSKSADFVDVFTKVKSFDKEPFSKAWVPLSKATGFEETDNTEQGFADLTSSMLEDVKQSKGSLSETYPSVMSVDCFMSQGQKSSYFVTEKRRLQGTWIQKKRAYLTYLNQICSIPFTRLFTKGYKAEAFTNFISRTNLQLSRFCVPQSTTLISDTVQNKKGGLALYRSAKQSVELKSNSPFLATQRTNILSLRSTNIEDVTQRGRDVRSKGGAVLSSALLKGSLSNSYFLHRTNISNIEDVSASRAKQGQDVKDVRNVKNTPITSSHIFPGQLVAYGDNIASNVVTTESGQVLYIDSEKTTVRKAQTVLIYSQAIIAVLSGDWIKKGTPLMSLSYQKLVTGDIVQGLPKIEQFFEAPVLRDGTFWSDSLQAKLNQFFQEEREKSPLAEAVRKSFSEIQRVLVEGVLRVYISQGVLIADKHLEVIVRQMTCKGRILYSGDTGFLRNELVSLDKIENVNQVTYGQKALYHPQVRGITDASLESESFLSAASFQETTRVLSRDAIIGKTDLMRGLKERVIVGELIQAGTGLANNSVYNFLTPSFS